MDQHPVLLIAAVAASALCASSCGCPGPPVTDSEPSETAEPPHEPDRACIATDVEYDGELLLPEHFCLLPEPIAEGCQTELSWWTGTGCPSYPELVRGVRPTGSGSGSWGAVHFQTFTVTRCAMPGDRAPVIEIVFGKGDSDSGQLYTAVFANGQMIRLDRLPYGEIVGLCCGDEKTEALVYGEPVRPDCTDGEVIGPETFADSGTAR